MDLQHRPLNTLALIRERVEQIASPAPAWTPFADWFETADDLILVMDVPGVEPESLELAHDGEAVILAGRRASQPWGEPRVSERPRGLFERSLALPEPVEPGSAEAQYRNGQLEVKFRKLGRTITVNGTE